MAFFATPLGRWLVIAALIAAALFAGGVYERNVQKQKDDDKYFAERKVQEEVNLKASNALNAKYRKKEVDDAAALAATGVVYAKNSAIQQQIHDRDVAAARSHALKLSIPASACNTYGGGVPGSPSSSSGNNGPATTDLPATVTERLYALADDADSVVAQLTACQQVIQSYTKGSQ